MKGRYAHLFDNVNEKERAGESESVREREEERKGMEEEKEREREQICKLCSASFLPSSSHSLSSSLSPSLSPSPISTSKLLSETTKQLKESARILAERSLHSSEKSLSHSLPYSTRSLGVSEIDLLSFGPSIKKGLAIIEKEIETLENELDGDEEEREREKEKKKKKGRGIHSLSLSSSSSSSSSTSKHNKTKKQSLSTYSSPIDDAIDTLHRMRKTEGELCMDVVERVVLRVSKCLGAAKRKRAEIQHLKYQVEAEHVVEEVLPPQHINHSETMDLLQASIEEEERENGESGGRNGKGRERERNKNGAKYLSDRDAFEYREEIERLKKEVEAKDLSFRKLSSTYVSLLGKFKEREHVFVADMSRWREEMERLQESLSLSLVERTELEVQLNRLEREREKLNQSNELINQTLSIRNNEHERIMKNIKELKGKIDYQSPSPSLSLTLADLDTRSLSHSLSHSLPHSRTSSVQNSPSYRQQLLERTALLLGDRDGNEIKKERVKERERELKKPQQDTERDRERKNASHRSLSAVSEVSTSHNSPLLSAPLLSPSRSESGSAYAEEEEEESVRERGRNRTPQRQGGGGDNEEREREREREREEEEDVEEEETSPHMDEFRGFFHKQAPLSPSHLLSLSSSSTHSPIIATSHSTIYGAPSPTRPPRSVTRAVIGGQTRYIPH